MECAMVAVKMVRKLLIALWLCGFSILNAVELSEFCKPNPSEIWCTVKQVSGTVTNNSSISVRLIDFDSDVIDNFINYAPINFTGNGSGFEIRGGVEMRNFINYSSITGSITGGMIQIHWRNIDRFINYGTINNSRVAIRVGYENRIEGYIREFINYGSVLTTNQSPALSFVGMDARVAIVKNFGTMNGVHTSSKTVIIDNRGVMQPFTYLQSTGHLTMTNTIDADNGHNNSSIYIKNFALKLDKSANDFNTYTYDTNVSNSHLFIAGNGDTHTLRFYDNNSRLILEFGENFELGKDYLLSNLIVKPNDFNITLPNIDISRIVAKNDLYKITANGGYFRVNLASGKDVHTPITELNKSNAKSMNSMFLKSNSQIFGGGGKGTSGAFTKAELNGYSKYLAMKTLKNNDRFFYKSDSLRLADNVGESNGESSGESSNLSESNMGESQNISESNESSDSNNSDLSKNTYRFFFTPYIAHNYFYESGNYGLSGLEGGFITGIGGKLDLANTLGAHFAFSYGTLNDKSDDEFKMTNMNFMIGLNYRFDFIYDMFIKARADFFYFINEVRSTKIANHKPDNIGFSLSAYYGKDFDFGEYGVLSPEVGLDYKTLSSRAINLTYISNSENLGYYDNTTYKMLYLDLGVGHKKYFDTNIGLWGLNTALGLRVHTTAPLAKNKIIFNNTTINATLDSDIVMGYVNLGFSYVLENKTHSMEFGLNFNGNYGDRSMSNIGNFEWQVRW